MPRVGGIGRKNKKKKVTTEVTAEGGAAAVGEVPDAEAQSKKRTRQSRKKAPPPPAPLQPPACRHFLQVLDYSRVVWASAAALENASFVLELAEERHKRQIAKGVATLERLRRKLREKPSYRSAKWTRDWLLTLDELEAEEIKLDGELQLRLDEVEACKRTLARQEESFVELRREWEAWHEYEKARMERRLEEKQHESDGSSPDSDSDSDSDELLTLDELVGKCVVDFDRKEHAGPS